MRRSLRQAVRNWIGLLTAQVTIALSLVSAGATGALELVQPSGSEVVVVYNSRVPESKKVAEHYAAARAVPTNQVLGLDMPVSEVIARPIFSVQIQRPLARLFEERNLWRLSRVQVRGESNTPARTQWRVTESKIRYLVLCYGVPLKIAADTNLTEESAHSVPEPFRRNEAAVDSELACLPMHAQHIPLFGGIQNPVFGVTNAAQIHPTNGVLMVCRLDAPNAQTASGLVDKALEAESNGLWGRAYFDIRSITGGYAIGDEWIRAAAEIARFAGFETIVDTNSATFPASFPMSHIALYAGWYEGGLAGPFALPTVEFMPGAFAYHLRSDSAYSMRHTNLWVPGLLLKGATVTMGTVEEPYLQCTPNIAVFFARWLLQGFTFGEAAYACQELLSWQTTVVGDPLYRPFAKPARQLHFELQQSKSKLIEWSHLRVVNLTLARGYPLAEAVNYLEQIPETTNSAVLTEKLAELYLAQGKPNAAIDAYRKALALNPSPQQRVRLLLNLAEQLLRLNRENEAYEVYKQFLHQCPNYADRLSIFQKLVALARKLGKPDVTTLEAELEKLSAPKRAP
ncbi:MAG: TIGR03790 family protein [Verrucomicrobiae bacterium]|nr:TIGR03790 family protein [Verrucomicrobiae bacterium]